MLIIVVAAPLFALTDYVDSCLTVAWRKWLTQHMIRCAPHARGRCTRGNSYPAGGTRPGRVGMCAAGARRGAWAAPSAPAASPCACPGSPRSAYFAGHAYFRLRIDPQAIDNPDQARHRSSGTIPFLASVVAALSLRPAHLPGARLQLQPLTSSPAAAAHL